MGIDLPAVQDWASFPALVSSTRKLNLGPLRVFCYVAYQHWRARNAKVHGREFGTSLILATTIMENIDRSTDFPSTRYWGTNRPDMPSPSIFWCPQPPDWIKVNVDGAVFPTIPRALVSSSVTTAGLCYLSRARGFPIGIPAKSSLRRSVLSAGFSPRPCWRLKVSLLRGTARMCWTFVATPCTGQLGATPT
ncbi:hypothetical protein KSP39_PZI008232 [Platanthera zijinensis]|uniref:Uncharacterized protein n=1 Tax=Platanthera zijinensis TaxID=2320716 RepID=A0AAP0G8R4_9ASPA